MEASALVTRRRRSPAFLHQPLPVYLRPMHRLTLSAPPPRHEQYAGDPLRRRSPPLLGAVGAGNKSRSGPLPRVAGLPRNASPSSSSSPVSAASSPSSSPPLSHSAVGADCGSDPIHTASSTSFAPAGNGVKTVTSIGEPTPLRRFLSADGEHEAVEVLREQFAHEKRITSDDVRYVVRVIASRGGRLVLPADFPPTRWILEFKHRYGFVAYTGAVADGASALANATAAAAGSLSALPAPSLLVRRPRDDRVGSDIGSVRSASVIARVTNSSCGSSVDSDGEGDGDGERNTENANYSMDVLGAPSRRRRRYGYGYGYEFGDAGPTKMRYAVPTGPYYDEDDSPTCTAEDKAVATPQEDPKTVNASFSQQQQQQNHQSQQQQQQRSSQLVPSLTSIMERRGLPWPSSVPPSVRTSHPDNGPPTTSSMSETSMSRSTSGSTGTSSSSRAAVGTSSAFAANSWGAGAGPAAVAARILAAPLAKKPVLSANSNGSTSNYSLQDDERSMSSTSSASDKRKYKLSHTVSPEIWEKAIAAVEQQGMSLRAAAKIYGVHFAALHRRVKKRAANGHAAKGSQGYFHPSDEAGIMRVVVARAELGVLMTFDELMELVETAALRKLPDISVEAARALMSRFQTRNEQSIRHIIVDWPLPRVAPHVAARLPSSPAMRVLPPAVNAIPVPAETTVPL